MFLVICLTEYLGKGLRIYSFVLCILKLCISMTIFIKLYILSYVLWSEFCVGGYFTHVVCYVIIEALFVPKRKIKKVYLSVLCEIPLQNQGQGDFLHIEAYSFCDLKYIHQVWYYSEIFSGVLPIPNDSGSRIMPFLLDLA